MRTVGYASCWLGLIRSSQEHRFLRRSLGVHARLTPLRRRGSTSTRHRINDSARSGAHLTCISVSVCHDGHQRVQWYGLQLVWFRASVPRLGGLVTHQALVPLHQITHQPGADLNDTSAFKPLESLGKSCCYYSLSLPFAFAQVRTGTRRKHQNSTHTHPSGGVSPQA